MSEQVIQIFVRMRYGPMRPHLYQQLSDFDSAFCLSLVTGSLVKSKLGQRFSLGSGGLFSRGGVRKGVVFENLGLFWSAV